MSKFFKGWTAALLLAAGSALQVGCQACGSCYDYSPPVSNCQCESCGCGHGGRSGSRLSGYYANNEEGDSLDQAVQVAEKPQEEGGLLVR